jgi:hypothetical protein
VIGDDGVGTGFGNVPNGILRGPGQINADISVIKAWQLGWPKQGANLQFRTDFFNATNHPNFSFPDAAYQLCTPTPANGGCTTSSGSAFGTITSTSTNPRLIQFAMRFAF